MGTDDVDDGNDNDVDDETCWSKEGAEVAPEGCRSIWYTTKPRMHDRIDGT